MAPANESSDSGHVVYWALNNYGVTVFELVVNLLIVLVAAAIMVLNALVLDTMIRVKKHHEPADVMICSLAIADLLTGLLLFHHTSYNLANYQIYVECLIRFGLLNGLVVTSVFHLVGVTLDRYIKIMSPYKYNQLCRLSYVAVISVFLWLLATLIALAPAMGWSERPRNGSELYTVRTEDDLPVCSYFGNVNPDYVRLMLAIFLASFILMGLLYIHIFKVASRHARQIAAQESSQPVSKLSDRHSWKYTKTVLIVLGLFFICWIPLGIVLIAYVTGYLSDCTVIEQGKILLYASASAYVNSFINPIIYAFKISAVRQRFRSTCCCKSHETGDRETSVRDLHGAGNATSVMTYNPTTENETDKIDLT